MADSEIPPSAVNETSLLARPAAGWAKLAGWGNSKVVQSCLIWVVIIPPMAKFLNWLYAKAGMALEIPPTMILLYFSAVLFAAASIIFKFFAPQIFATAPTFSEFARNNHSALDLKHWFHRLSQYKRDGKTVVNAKRIQEFLTHAKRNAALTSQQAAEVLTGVAGHGLLDEFWWVSPTKESLPALHEITIKAGDGVRSGLRLTASICYWIGFGLFSFVALLNIIAVVKYLGRIPSWTDLFTL